MCYPFVRSFSHPGSAGGRGLMMSSAQSLTGGALRNDCEKEEQCTGCTNTRWKGGVTDTCNSFRTFKDYLFKSLCKCEWMCSNSQQAAVKSTVVLSSPEHPAWLMRANETGRCDAAGVTRVCSPGTLVISPTLWAHLKSWQSRLKCWTFQKIPTCNTMKSKNNQCGFKKAEEEKCFKER